MEKPSVRAIDYVTLVQSGVMTIDELPKDIQEEVAKWLSFFVSGESKEEVKDNEQSK